MYRGIWALKACIGAHEFYEYKKRLLGFLAIKFILIFQC